MSPMDKPTETADYTWEEYEKLIYRDVAYRSMHTRIEAALLACAEIHELPPNWPGIRKFANAVMKVVTDKL